MKTKRIYYKLFLLSLIALQAHSCGKTNEKLSALQKEASAAYLRKDLNEALSLYNQILEIDSNSIATLIMLGKIHYFKKDFQNAAEMFEKAVDKDDQNVVARYWLSKIESMREDRRKESKESLGEIINNIPNRWEVQYTLGTILESEGKIEDALTLYNQATAESSKLALIYLRLGKIFKKANREQMAEQYFSKAKMLSEESPESHRLIQLEIEKD
ncbi:tetratricopeptide repeat protein [Leptospira kmetyi]|uniref:tetratricopeptide repeat protein n=1 Tax=Leptospira kmetyi TaxID=408139 RepID=UPI003EBBF38C